MLLMIEKGIRGGIGHSIYMEKPITYTWKIIIKIKNCPIFNIGM